MSTSNNRKTILGSCGSCWAHAAVGCLEALHFFKTKKLATLSEQNLVDCSTEGENEGCNGGDFDAAFEYVIRNGGIDTEDSYPYAAKDGLCKFDEENVGTKVKKYFHTRRGDEEDLKLHVGTVGPIAVGISVIPNFYRYKSGIFYEPECNDPKISHAVLIVGYGNEKGNDYWIVKNSWSKQMMIFFFNSIIKFFFP